MILRKISRSELETIHEKTLYLYEHVGVDFEHPELLEELLKTKKLPIARLVSGSGVDRKTIERHRKYLVALLLIYTNGYEIIRGHLKQIMKGVAAQ